MPISKFSRNEDHKREPMDRKEVAEAVTTNGLLRFAWFVSLVIEDQEVAMIFIIRKKIMITPIK